MFAGIRKRLTRKQTDSKDCDDDDKDDFNAITPPTNYITISQGKIQLVHQPKSLERDFNDGQNKKNESHSGSPTFEKELREQLENMNREIKSKQRKQMQSLRDQKVLQTRFARQENLLHALQHENKALMMRIRQYEHCLDDVMRKVVDAIVAEDNLRDEVSMLKSRVRDLEAQNASLLASPAKGRDEGYCTMSSGQPQPSNNHLEDLPEEPEQWLLPAEPCSTEMEDWSMSQEELSVIPLDEERDLQLKHQQKYIQKRNGDPEWMWSSNDFLSSTVVETDSISDSISQLLQQKIVYSEDEEFACTEFTNDFYKLVNIRSNSARSFYSYIEGETDGEDDDDSSVDDNLILSNQESFIKSEIISPTPSEAGRAQLISCSSSESEETSQRTLGYELPTHIEDNTRDQANCSSLQYGNHFADAQLVSERIDADELNSYLNTVNNDHRPAHILVKSKSTINEDEHGFTSRSKQRHDVDSHVVRSESMNSAIGDRFGGNKCEQKSWERSSQKPANSWRRSNGWKRVSSPTQRATGLISPKKEIKAEILKNIQVSPKKQPTKIPTCKSNPQQSKQVQHVQQLPTRKSKIPPPVPVRRSYAS